MTTPEQEGKPNQLPFSPTAEQVIVGAKKTAKRLNHEYARTGHLLLSLIQEKIIDETLRLGFNIEYGKISGAVQFIIGYGKDPVTGTPGLSLRFQRVIDFADLQAKEDKQQEITELDLLIGVIREGQGVGASVLAQFGLDENNLYKLKTTYINLKRQNT